MLRGDEAHVRCTRALAARIVLGGERHAVALAQLLETHVHERRAVEEHILEPVLGPDEPEPTLGDRFDAAAGHGYSSSSGAAERKRPGMSDRPNMPGLPVIGHEPLARATVTHVHT